MFASFWNPKCQWFTICLKTIAVISWELRSYCVYSSRGIVWINHCRWIFREFLLPSRDASCVCCLCGFMMVHWYKPGWPACAHKIHGTPHVRNAYTFCTSTSLLCACSFQVRLSSSVQTLQSNVRTLSEVGHSALRLRGVYRSDLQAIDPDQ